LEIEPPAESQQPTAYRKYEWLESEDYYNRTDYCQDDDDEDLCLIEGIQDAQVTLEDFLKDQIEKMELPKSVAAALYYLVGCLDDNGYLPAGPDVLAKESGISEKLLRSAWQVLMEMDPPGIGAVTLSQCILLQLERKGLADDTITRIVENYLEQLAKGNYQQVAQKVGKTTEDIRGYVRLIGKMNPKPCAPISRPKTTQYVIPDLVVTRIQDHLDIRLSDDTVPHVVVRRDYLHMLHGEPTMETRRYIDHKLRQADWVVRSIEGRAKTLLAVGQLILKKQKKFFLNGPKYLNPITLSYIADELQLHISTISRAISGKYLQCQYGSFPLKYFFPQGVASETGAALASTGVKEQIKEMIEVEDKGDPLSDQELANRLTEMGIEISRRTVAKYRDQIGIRPALLRKTAR
jgi:RNA polymerase sigma-54 factor